MPLSQQKKQELYYSTLTLYALWLLGERGHLWNGWLDIILSCVIAISYFIGAIYKQCRGEKDALIAYGLLFITLLINALTIQQQFATWFLPFILGAIVLTCITIVMDILRHKRLEKKYTYIVFISSVSYACLLLDLVLLLIMYIL